MIPDGMRAVSVRVNDVIGVAGYVLPGTKVDVLVTRQARRTSGRHDVEGDSEQRAGAHRGHAASNATSSKDNKPISVSVVTLLVDPLQSEALTLASTEGKIQLALRNPLDKTVPATPGIQPAIAAWAVGRRATRGREPHGASAPAGAGTRGSRAGAGAAPDDRNHPR